MAQVIEGYRDVLMRHSMPDFSGLASVLIVSGLLIGAMLLYFQWRDAAYARLVVQ
jgi:ABC-type polysaccharide/polyol phosphate export permease